MKADAPTRERWYDPGLIGNAVALAALALLAVALLQWQVEPLRWRPPGAARWIVSGLVSLLYVAFVAGVIVARHRRHRIRRPAATAADTATDWLVAYASQTGHAEQLAGMSADALRAAGLKVRVTSLGELDNRLLQQTTRALFIASTTGEGDAPDPALSFIRRSMAEAATLPQLRYGLLALGDRDYPDYCAFGHRLDAWLRHSHAHALFDTIEVDNAEPGALRLWQQHIGQLAGRTDLPDWNRPAYRTWRLHERRHLNPGSLGGAVFHLGLVPEDAGQLAWEAGDIAEIGPRHADEDVRHWLRANGLDGKTRVRDGESICSLHDALAGARLPSPDAVRGLDAQAIANILQPLPHREYSIASIPAEGQLQLLVRQMRHADGRPGIGSGWLTAHAAPGDAIALRIRGNRAFHLPDDGRPLVLIGNGTGLAGLRALLRARIERGHARNWLLFGERQQARDFHYRAELEAWRASGHLQRMDLAFSRDQQARIHVQGRLREAFDTLRQWVADGASVHVCGSLEGMAPGVDAALREGLGDDAVDAMIEDGRYRRDVY
jgi:sulfite reductase (NADPH) flavoprotein alpha-component